MCVRAYPSSRFIRRVISCSFCSVDCECLILKQRVLPLCRPIPALPRTCLGECRPPGSSFCLAISSSATIPPGGSLPQGRPREARRPLREWAFYGRRCLEGLTRCWLLPALRSGLAPRKRGSTAFLVNLSISSHTCALRHTYTLRLIDTHTFTRKQKHIHTD